VHIVGVFFILASAAQAQPTIGNEVVWRTTSAAATYQPAPQAAPIAADGVGFAVAWSEFADGLSRAYAGRLDAAGNLIEVGVRTAGTADAASVVPSGDRYIAAWLEPDSSVKFPALITAALDRDFKLLHARNAGVTLGRPVVRVTPSRTYVGAGGALYEVDRDGVPVNAFFVGATIDDVGAADDQVGYVVHSTSHTPPICGFFGCSQAFDTYSLTFTWLFRVTLGDSWRFLSDAPVGVGTNGSEFLYVYFDGAAHLVKAVIWGPDIEQLVLSERLPPLLDALNQPQIAWDGARWLVVWSAGASIEGAAVAHDHSVTPFTISASGLRPAVAAAKQGRFLVTYEVIDVAGRRLASRVIDFNPPRGRAVR